MQYTPERDDRAKLADSVYHWTAKSSVGLPPAGARPSTIAPVTIAWACLLTCVTAGLSFSFQAKIDDRLCSVKGLVTDAATDEPLSKAFVRVVASSSENTANYPAVTDEGGRFNIQGIKPGHYFLEGEKQGFLQAQYGGGFDQVRVELKLSAGEELAGLKIRLTPQAVIAGHVVDQDGDVWTHAYVNVYRSVWRQGRRQLQGYSSGEINDQGEFRVGGLPPGRYYVTADPDHQWELRHRPAKGPDSQLLLQPTWYPATRDVDSATPINLAPGQLASVEIRLQAGSVRNIRGELLGLKQIPEPRGPALFSRVSLSASQITNRSEATSTYFGTLRADGTFEVKGLPPGRYEIRVSQGFPTVELGHRPVQISDRDLENVSVDLQPPHSLQGTIRMEGDQPWNETGTVVVLEPLDSRDQAQRAVVKKAGGFEFDQLGVERYRIRLLPGNSNEQLYLKLIRYGEEESRNYTFSLAGAEERNLELVVSAKGAGVTGHIQREGDVNHEVEKDVAPRVVLIPDTADASEREADTRVAVFDQHDIFTINGLPPGSYKMYAFESVPDDSWSDAEFLRAIAEKATDVRISEGDTKNIELKLIPLSDIADVLTKLGMN